MATATAVTTPASARRAREARKARHRLYPVSGLYSLYALVLLGWALVSGQLLRALAWFAVGALTWTLVEYLVHRYVLHGHFPDAPGLWRHFLHTHFDHLHWEHHERPWDGEHISGTVRDTFRFVMPMAVLSFLASPFTASMLVAGIVQCYVIEEWVHHSVHFYDLRGSYFNYIRRHHLFHHSPKGDQVGYGLTSGMWDVVFRTRIPAAMRLALYGGRRGARSERAGQVAIRAS